ncbi:hypothetical protein IT400_04340 [Candidatus Nomurabacteria bacterium]|nr:hypothetical protein [Candidatus Nomurabacteria bacterium]
MEPTAIDHLLLKSKKPTKKDIANRYIDHYLEQYRIYVHVFNSTSERRNKANEFFLGLNAAIIGIIGYVETKALPHASMIFVLVPIAGIAICHCWYRIICAYRQLNRAKFKVIHTAERNLPLSLFETEWNILGKGKDRSKYYPLSQIEKNIPVIFILLYCVILLMNINVDYVLDFFK